MYMYISKNLEGGGARKSRPFFPEDGNGDVKKNRAFKNLGLQKSGGGGSKPRVFDHIPTGSSPCLPA